MSAIDLTNMSSDEEAPAKAEEARPAKRRRTSGGGGGGGGGGAAGGGAAGGGAAGATVLDLTEDDEAPAAAAAAPAAPPPDDKPPPWLKQNGARRIMAEFRALTEALQMRPGSLGALRSAWLPNEDEIATWRLECRGFDTDLQGGRDINADLESMGVQTGGASSSITMEVTFPKDYPTQPFFLRVVTPRMVM